MNHNISVGQVVYTFASHSNKADRSIRCVVGSEPSDESPTTLYLLESPYWLCNGVYRASSEFSTEAQIVANTHNKPPGTLVLTGWGGPQDGGYLVLPEGGYTNCATYRDAVKVCEERGAMRPQRYDPMASYTGTALGD